MWWNLTANGETSKVTPPPTHTVCMPYIRPGPSHTASRDLFGFLWHVYMQGSDQSNSDAMRNLKLRLCPRRICLRCGDAQWFSLRALVTVHQGTLFCSRHPPEPTPSPPRQAWALRNTNNNLGVSEIGKDIELVNALCPRSAAPQQQHCKALRKAFTLHHCTNQPYCEYLASRIFFLTQDNHLKMHSWLSSFSGARRPGHPKRFCSSSRFSMSA